MNREIKFRAWHPDTKEMMPVETIDWDETQYLTEVSAGYTWGEKFDPDKFQKLVLMQYTGMKDKEGKEIWEGDIIVEMVKLEIGSLMEIFGEVFYNENVGAFDFRPFKKFAGLKASWTIGLNCKVLGNIYQNPELIKTYASI